MFFTLVLELAEDRAKTIDWKNILADKLILPPELLNWINEEAVHPFKRAKVEVRQPLKELVNRFGGSVTDVGTLATYSKGFFYQTLPSTILSGLCERSMRGVLRETASTLTILSLAAF